MTTTAHISIVKDGASLPWPELEAQLKAGTLHATTQDPYFALIEGGTSEGLPSVAVRVELPNGDTVVWETTLQLFIGVLAAARGAFPEAFVGGPFAGP